MERIHLPGCDFVGHFVGAHSSIFEPDEMVVAIYENGQLNTQHVVFTDIGIRYHDDEWRILYYKLINNARVVINDHDADAKLRARYIVIASDGSADVQLKFDGGNEPFRDVFEVSRFINRVSTDVNKVKGQK
jgi:hypothetical protein